MTEKPFSEEMRAFVLETFMGLTSAEQELLADVFASVNADAQQSRTLGVARDKQYAHRVLDDGAALTTDVAGTLNALTTTSLFDTFNFIGGGGAIINADNRRQVDIRLGGGLDCQADHIVSSCWATTVAAGDGTEGQTFSSLTAPTCSFRVWSTVQGAVTAAEVVNAAQDIAQVIYICGGTYAEAVADTGTGGAAGIEIIGAGKNRTIIQPVTGVAYTHVSSPSQTPGHKLIMRNLTLDGDGGASGTYGLVTTGDDMVMHSVRILGNTSGWHVKGSSADSAIYRLYDCDVSEIAMGDNNDAVTDLQMFGGELGGWTSDVTGNGNPSDRIQLIGVIYTGSLNFKPCNDLYVSGQFRVTTPTRLITFTKATNSVKEFRRVVLDVMMPALNGTSVAAYGVLVNTDCFIRGGSSRCTFQYPSNVTQVVNYWKVDGGVESFGFEDNFEVDGSHLSLEENKTYKSIDASGGIIRQSSFNCKGPRYQVDVGTGTKNTINGVEFDSGAPTHESHEGAEYWDTAANTMYVNTDGATTWAVLGVAGGGAAAAAHNHEVHATLDGATASTTVSYQTVRVPNAGTVVGVHIRTGDGVSIGATAVIVDIHKILLANINTDATGTTIYTTQGNRPTITNGNKGNQATAPDVTAVADGDNLAFFCDVAGTGAGPISVAVEISTP